MSGQQVKYVNVIPHARIKKEFIDDEDEASVQCKICTKAFMTDTALNNHARMEHIEVFATGDRNLWAEPIVREDSSSLSLEKKEKDKTPVSTAKLLASMGSTNLMNLASDDVSYIIIKAEPRPKPKERKRKAEKPGSQTEKVIKKEKDKEPQPITGPFECLQPSTLVTDGTCHQIFFSCCEYSAHCRDEHTRRRKGTRCQVCEKPLAGFGDTQSPFPCEVCGAGFQTNKELSDHMAIDHVKLKPFECSICHKRFTQQGGVQQHMRMHTGDRPFPCTFCPKAFTQKSGLDQHLRIHTKVKPYRCIICSKAFCQSIHLKQHMRTHTNVAPFQCGICSKRFKQSSHLNYHLKNHNPAVMSNEQKQEYHKLLAMMPKVEKKVDKQKVICVQGENGGVEYLQVSDEEIQCNEVQMETEVFLEEQEDEEGNQEENQEESQEESQEEQEQLVLAESSIQEGDTYILGESSDEVWSVKLVEDD